MVSTSATLSGNATFTSPAQAIEPNQGRITGTVISDRSGTLYVEQGFNGSDWDISTTYQISANDGKGFTEPVISLFWRVRYVNGNSGQSTFRLFTKPRL